MIMNNKIFMNKKTKEEYIALPTNNGHIKLFSLSVDNGSKDIIIDKEDFSKNYIKKQKEKEENIMKLFVLTWGKQDEIGRVFYHDTHVELFKTEEEACKRVLALGKEFVPNAKDTEELANGLIELEDNCIPSLLFDIDTIEL